MEFGSGRDLINHPITSFSDKMLKPKKIALFIQGHRAS